MSAVREVSLPPCIEGNGQALKGDRSAIAAGENFLDLPDVTTARAEDDRVSLSVREPHVALPALLARLEAMNCRLTGLTTRHASLEDVFVTLTGRHLRDGETTP